MSTTVYSERRDATLHLGKLPASERRAGTLTYASDIRPALGRAGLLPPLPAMFGHGHDFAQGLWWMLGNGPPVPNEENAGEPIPEEWTAALEGCGDCTIAGPVHEEMEAATSGKGSVPKIGAKTTVQQYAERCKVANGQPYDPVTGEGDTGLDIQDVNEWREQEGIADDEGNRYKILKPIALEPGNIQELWEATWLFEKTGLGLVICQAQMDQFDASTQPTWDYVAGSPEEGGHYVPAMGKLGLISWAEDVYYTPKFIEKQNDESYAYPDPLIFAERTGKDPEGFDLADIEQFAVLLAQSKLEAAGVR